MSDGWVPTVVFTRIFLTASGLRPQRSGNPGVGVQGLLLSSEQPSIRQLAWMVQIAGFRGQGRPYEVCFATRPNPIHVQTHSADLPPPDSVSWGLRARERLESGRIVYPVGQQLEAGVCGAVCR